MWSRTPAQSWANVCDAGPPFGHHEIGSSMFHPSGMISGEEVDPVSKATKHGSDAGPMLGHRLRRWPSIDPASDQCGMALEVCVWGVEPAEFHTPDQ